MQLTMFQPCQKEKPGEIHNSSLLAQNLGRGWHRDTALTVLKEDAKEGRDFIIIPRGVWLYFRQVYKATAEIKRYSITASRNGILIRQPYALFVKVGFIKRMQHLKSPKIVPIKAYTSIQKFR